MAKKAILIGTLDTKGLEFKFIKEILENSDVETIVIDTGVLGDPLFEPDISSEEVARAGGSSVEELRKKNDRGEAIAVMTSGISQVVNKLVEAGSVGGIFGMGGTAGTTVGAVAMRGAPIGIPKLLVSTVASGDTRPYVGVKDVMMMYSVVDIAGLNKLSRTILKNAANALSGMIKGLDSDISAEEDKTMLAMTMFGVTTPCATRVREILENKGFDVLVFHATGTGGMAMEDLIQSGFIKGVVDITTTELADYLVGGIFSAGSSRLEAAGKARIPQIVSVGALDMVNFGPIETVPQQFKDRLFYQHNPTTTLMRTTVKENEKLGQMLSEKLNKSSSPTVLLFPKGGVSLLDLPGKAFEGPEQRQALYNAIKKNLRPDIPMIETEKDINDPDTAELIANQFMQMMN